MTYDDEEDWTRKTYKKKIEGNIKRNYCEKEKPEHKKKKNKDKK